MRKLATSGLAVLTAVALAAVAFAADPPTITSTLKVTPAKGGTKAKPLNARIVNVFNVNPESESTLKRIEYTIPKNVKLNGKGFPTCTVDEISANGDEGCPKLSKVGSGAATALLGPQKTSLIFDVAVYVSGPKTLTLYLKTNLFTIPIPADIVGQKVQFDIPERVQSPVGGLYSYVTSVTADLGKQPGIAASIKKKVKGKTKSIPFASLVGCTGGKHSGSVTAFLADNPNPPPVPSITANATSPCKA